MPRYPVLTAEQEKKVTALVERMTKAFDPLPPHLQTIQHFMTGDQADAATPHNPTREFCYCFLISREWDVDKAFDMMQRAVDYRATNKLDQRAQFPTAISCNGWDQDAVRTALDKEARPTDQRLDRLYAGIEPFFSLGFHKWDKFGQPVLYMMIGSIDEAGLLKKLKSLANIGQSGEAVMWEIVQHALGVDEHLQYYQQMQYNKGQLKVDAADGLIRSTTLVIDLKGLTYKMLWKPALDLFMNTLKEIFKYYSQCVYQILIVNSPAMVMFAYKIVRGVLPSGVQQKVHIVNMQDTQETMKLFIDEANIPDFLGGSCGPASCPDGCIRGYDPAGKHQKQSEKKKTKDSASAAVASDRGSTATATDASTSHAGDEGVATEDISLKAGHQHKRVFSLKMGESVVWEFASSNGQDVTFMKYFVPEAEAKGLNWEKVHTPKLEPFIVSKENPSEGSDEFCAVANGVLLLVWDNKKSWFTAKRIQMKVFKQAAGEDAA